MKLMINIFQKIIMNSNFFVKENLYLKKIFKLQLIIFI